MAKTASIDTSYTPIVHDDKYILEVNNLKKYFPIKDGLLQKTVGYVKAVDGITFNIERGTTMGLVGESGCGKTTVGRTILRLTDKTAGQVLFNGEEVHDLAKDELRKKRTEMQIIFQDPYSSLSPRLPIGEIIGEAVCPAITASVIRMSSPAASVSVYASLAPLHSTPSSSSVTSRFPRLTFRYRLR